MLVFALPYLNDSYQALVDSAAKNTNSDNDSDGAGREFQLGPDGESVPVFRGEQEKERLKRQRRFDDRAELIEEVVFRLEAQAKSPASTNVVDIAGDVRLPGRYPLLGARSLNALIAWRAVLKTRVSR